MHVDLVGLLVAGVVPVVLIELWFRLRRWARRTNENAARPR